jgi:hypothetical protein
MDVGVIPSSNPFAWMRLTDHGIDLVIRTSFSDGEEPSEWIEKRLAMAKQGHASMFPLKDIEAATSGLSAECYREGEEVRNRKRDLGRRRALPIKERAAHDNAEAVRRLKMVSMVADEPVLVSAAQSLTEYLQ